MQVRKLERPFRLHRLRHLEEARCRLGELSDTLCVGRARENFGVGGERSGVREDVLGEDGGVRRSDRRDEHELRGGRLVGSTS